MRPKKTDVPMKDWSREDLCYLINNKKSNPVKVKEAQDILTQRRNDTNIILDFFNPSKNRFWNLALWQLYREGKAKVFIHNNQKKFYVEDKSLVFDTMIKIQRRYDKYKINKKVDITGEFETWKR